MLPDCSSDASSKPEEKQTSTHGKEVSTETEKEVINVLERIKLAKDSDNTVQGLISKNTNFRSNQSQEQFLFDTGASVCIIGWEVAKDNKLKINKLTSPRNIIEASG